MTSIADLDLDVRPPSFGEALTEHAVTARWTARDGWERPKLESRGCLPADVAMAGLHYGQVVFEGLKVYRQADGGTAVFRAPDHARRFARSAQRLALPEVPAAMFTAAIEMLVAVDGEALGDAPGLSLYLRPLLCASEPSLALRPARECLFILAAFVTGGLFAGDPESVAIWVTRDYCRASPGGTGDIKCAGNYAPAYAAQRQAEEAGCQQVLWLDPVERRWVEEIGTMNIFFVRGARLFTPPKTGTLLPGITRDSLLTLGANLGYQPAEESISLDQLRHECEHATITEVFGSGTAASVTPIGRIRDGREEWLIGDGYPGPTTLALRKALVDVQHGRSPDQGRWRQRLSSAPHNVTTDPRSTVASYGGVRHAPQA